MGRTSYVLGRRDSYIISMTVDLVQSGLSTIG
jgi:hypothetical protein